MGFAKLKGDGAVLADGIGFAKMGSGGITSGAREPEGADGGARMTVPAAEGTASASLP